ncbi:MAG TPA: hypothetical protein VHB21_11480 [Minicystis sp.]|nr:hypothetical protein [Minicystis sp.]
MHRAPRSVTPAHGSPPVPELLLDEDVAPPTPSEDDALLDDDEDELEAPPALLLLVGAPPPTTWMPVAEDDAGAPPAPAPQTHAPNAAPSGVQVASPRAPSAQVQVRRAPGRQIATVSPPPHENAPANATGTSGIACAIFTRAMVREPLLARARSFVSGAVSVVAPRRLGGIESVVRVRAATWLAALLAVRLSRT